MCLRCSWRVALLAAPRGPSRKMSQEMIRHVAKNQGPSHVRENLTGSNQCRLNYTSHDRVPNRTHGTVCMIKHMSFHMSYVGITNYTCPLELTRIPVPVRKVKIVTVPNQGRFRQLENQTVPNRKPVVALGYCEKISTRVSVGQVKTPAIVSIRHAARPLTNIMRASFRVISVIRQIGMLNFTKKNKLLELIYCMCKC